MSLAEHGIYIPAGAEGEVATLCPKCSSSRRKKGDRCLSVNVEKEVWNCHHCGWTGGTKKKGLMKTFKPQPPKEYVKPQPIASGMHEKADYWLSTRLISDATATLCKVIGTDKKIIFPYYRDGQLINAKHRLLEEKRFRMEKGAERCLYNMDVASAWLSERPSVKTLIWVEGEVDALSLVEAGYGNVVSVPDGAPDPKTKNYASKFDYLESAEGFVSKFNKHIICTDSDPAGNKLAEELSRRLGPEKCKRVVYPDDCKDANEVLVKGGRQALRDLITGSKDFPVRGIHDINDIVTDIFAMHQGGDEPGMSTGWFGLDQIYTVRQGELTVVTGVPNHGKSEWLDALMVNLAMANEWRFAICSPENMPLARHFAKIASKYIGKPFNPGPSERMTEKELASALAWGNEHFTFLLPEDEELTVDNLLELCRILIYRKGIKGLVIDPWGDLNHRLEEGENETGYIGRQLKKLRQFARDHRIHIFVVAHPKQLLRDREGKYPVPSLYDISGSAHWRNKVDNGICIYRENVIQKKDGGGQHDVEADTVDVYVQKVRFKQVGQQGVRSLYYDRVTGRYYPTPESLLMTKAQRRKEKHD